MTTTELPAVSVGSYEDELAKGHLTEVEFQADAALIRELGERLVGAPQIALAELVKNAYDADATECRIGLWGNRIVVSDNGHGMSESDFRRFWMRIGTTNKRQTGKSKTLQRNLTGSKGVGRLSAQFLAHRLQIVTVADEESAAPFHALVDWDAAVTAGDLTKARAKIRIEQDAEAEFPRESRHGTIVVLEGLKHTWSESEVRDLGRELWMLNSPLPRFGMVTTGGDDARDFNVVFSTPLPGLDQTFREQMRAAIDSYYAIVEGEITSSKQGSNVQVRIRFRDGDIYSENFPTSPLVHSAKWQVRIYDLVGRQASGVPVRLGREYFEQFGVMVFDAGFRLPYYGIGSDWLGIDYDHAHRLSRSSLLPDRLQVERGLNDLPSQGRMLGVVSIDTGSEARHAEQRPPPLNNDYLQILVTRDRLVSNGAYRTLRDAVRQSLDFYATRQRQRMARTEMAVLPSEGPGRKIERLASLVSDASAKFRDDPIIIRIDEEVTALGSAIDQQARADESARALLGPLAAAGMAALALEHENRKDVVRAVGRIEKLRELASRRGDPELTSLVDDLAKWIARLEDSRKLFAQLIDSDGRDRVEALPAAGVLREIVGNVKSLLPGMPVDIAIPREILFPPATFAEWHAIFQNVLINGANAMLDVSQPRLLVQGGRTGRKAWVRVSDKGVGVDVATQNRLFEPFNRTSEISPDRQELGLGGMGLGLTIVRMIANQRNCAVSFVTPADGWTTTFELNWTSAS